MDPNLLTYVAGVSVILLVGLLNLIESRRTRHAVEAALGPRRAGSLGEPRMIATGMPAPGTSPTPPPDPGAQPPRERDPGEPAPPDTAREPAVRRADLEALGRELDAADQAQADQAPAPRSGADVAVAPP